jgi:hypothetical protein
MKEEATWTLNHDLEWVKETSCKDDHFYYYNDGNGVCPVCKELLLP